ncbi:MAG TPA: helix-turn-helix transcriptional regulator [Acidobacteriaceae bacterium]|nr:helix-turn-helix transcriptional regulator [Acidobacteriaceae bacterium]
MSDFTKSLTKSLRDEEYAETYAEVFQDTYLATQIKVIREQRGKSQAELGQLIGTTQGGISRVEDASYSGWTVKTLKKIAKALNVRLRISLEEYGSLPGDVIGMNRGSLMRAAHQNDLVIFPEKISASAANRILLMDIVDSASHDRADLVRENRNDEENVVNASRFSPASDLNQVDLSDMNRAASGGMTIWQ